MDRQLDFKELLDLPVVIMDELREEYPEKFTESGQMDWKWFEKDIRPNYFVYIRRDKNSLSFTMKDKPTSEGGKGAEAIHLIEAARLMIQFLDEKFPCNENKHTICHLEAALRIQHGRTKDREDRGVEGKNEL